MGCCSSKVQEKRDKLTKFLTVTDRDFVLIFIGFLERVFNSTIPSGISHLVSLYADAQNRIIWINNLNWKSEHIRIEDGSTIQGGYGTVLLGDPKALNISQIPKYEVVLKINEKAYRHGFYVGYVFAPIEEFHFNCCVGYTDNGSNSVGIEIRSNKFYLYNRNYHGAPLKCKAEDAPSTIPPHGQFWRVTWDLIHNEMEISVLNEQEADWIPMLHYAMKEEHGDVIPGISMRDSIDLTLQWKSLGKLECGTNKK